MTTLTAARLKARRGVATIADFTAEDYSVCNVWYPQTPIPGDNAFRASMLLLCAWAREDEAHGIDRTAQEA